MKQKLVHTKRRIDSDESVFLRIYRHMTPIFAADAELWLKPAQHNFMIFNGNQTPGMRAPSILSLNQLSMCVRICVGDRRKKFRGNFSSDQKNFSLWLRTNK
ncbi:MAG TPA: hypothetical protein VI479_03600, partial [Blastocatellia bacterium]